MTDDIPYFENYEVSIIGENDGFIDKGGCAVIRHGYHVTFAEVALKCVAKSSDMAIQSVMEEMRLQRLTQHKNVVKIYGWTELPREIRIIMEYIPGGSLAIALRDRYTSIDALQRLQICFDVANGLSYIHRQDIVHGDIKPENVLMSENLRAKICDFGSARMLHLSAIPFQYSFTPLHAPPEHRENSLKQLSYDTYSFAITMLRVITPEVPFPLNQSLLNCSNPQEGLRNISIFIHPFITRNNQNDPEIINRMVEVMQDCWQNNPTHRPLMIDAKTRLKSLLLENDNIDASNYDSDSTSINTTDTSSCCSEANSDGDRNPNDVDGQSSLYSDDDEKMYPINPVDPGNANRTSAFSRVYHPNLRPKKTPESVFSRTAVIINKLWSSVVEDEPNDEGFANRYNRYLMVMLVVVWFVLIKLVVGFFEKAFGFCLALLLCYGMFFLFEKKILDWLRK